MKPTTLGPLDAFYRDRLDTAWRSLRKDIVERWRNIDFGEDKVIAHHIQEFEKFSKSAYERLKSSPPSTLESEDFRAIVIGVLTAYWNLLRQVATQRLENSPYREDLKELDQLSIRDYHRLRTVLPQQLKGKVSTCAPIIHLGDISMLTIYNQQPLVLSTPINAIDRDDPNAERSRASISHEIAHAILIQVPEILDELNSHLSSIGENLSGLRKVLNNMIVGWLEEILADMIGTTLARDIFVVSAIWITATSETNVGLADDKHPPTVIRPFIHLKVLEHLEQLDLYKSPAREEQIAQLKDSYNKKLENLSEQFMEQTVGNRLERQFKSIPALTFITLKDVKEALEETVILLLKSKGEQGSLPLKALDGETIGDLLTECAQHADIQPADNQRVPWGDIPTEDSENFILPLPGNLATIFHTPMTLSKGICDWLPFLPFCRR